MQLAPNLRALLPALLVAMAGPAAAEAYAPPSWYSFPPYFTLQPVRDTRERQVALWKEFILDFCRAHKTFVVHVDEDTPLFFNAAIKRRLREDARRTVLAALVVEGRAQWLDASQTRCLVHWCTPARWADAIYDWVKANGMQSAVMTLDELTAGEETVGAAFHGLHPEALSCALRQLEADGRAKLFKGASGDDQGVKFFTK